jgi:hypothetical protein
MTYTGPHTPGGEDVTLTGTAQEIHAKILKLNPNFNPADFVDNSTIAAREAEHALRLEKRNKVSVVATKQSASPNAPSTLLTDLVSRVALSALSLASFQVLPTLAASWRASTILKASLEAVVSVPGHVRVSGLVVRGSQPFTFAMMWVLA